MLFRQLGIAALAMINRNRSLVFKEELERDLQAVDASAAGSAASAIDVIDRFYFTHTSQAITGTGQQRRAIEFLHGSFGDFLAARLIVQALRDLATERVFFASRPIERHLDAGFLYAATSFIALSDRSLLADLVEQLLLDVGEETQGELRALLKELSVEALELHPGWSFPSYEPVELSVVRRKAAYSLNLVLFEVMLSPEGMVWRTGRLQSLANLWRSQLGEETVTDALDYLRVMFGLEVHDDRFSVPTNHIRREDGAPVHLRDVAPVIANLGVPLPSDDVVVPADGDVGQIMRRTALINLPGVSEEMLLQAMAPYWHHLGAGSRPWDARAVYELLLAPPGVTSVEDRVSVYLIVPTAAAHLALRQLPAEVSWLGDDATVEVLIALLRSRLDYLLRTFRPDDVTPIFSDDQLFTDVIAEMEDPSRAAGELTSFIDDAIDEYEIELWVKHGARYREDAGSPTHLRELRAAIERYAESLDD